MRECTRCHILQPETEFHLKNNTRRSHCKTCAKVERRAYYKANKKKWRGYEIKRRFGDRIDISWYDAQLKAQGGRCAICRHMMTTPHIDHDHDTGAIRGLLCHRCNRSLGLIGEHNLQAAVDYLAKVA